MQLAINAENYILLAALFFPRFSMCGPSLIEEKTKKIAHFINSLVKGSTL